MTAAKYESPEINLELTKEEIHKRYQDTSLFIFQEQNNKRDVRNYLTFGTSRRTVEYSNYGNEPIIIRRPPQRVTTAAAAATITTSATTVTQLDNRNVAMRILKLYRKPSHENCTIT